MDSVLNVHTSLSSPQRDDAAPQDDDIKLIASQMEWDNDHDDGDQYGDEESDNIGVESGDEQGPRIGLGACVGNMCHDLLDPHLVPARERWLGEVFDPDYESLPPQVTNT